MRVGARVWKTALAVAAALGISRLLGIEHPVFAGVAAIICMQPTVFGSLRSGRERMQATVIGAIFSLAALILLEHVPALDVIRPGMVGLTVLAVMAVMIRLKWFDSLVLAAATVVVIMVLPSDENIYWYSASRTAVTFVGIVVATAVNALLLTPQYRTPLWRRLDDLTVSTSRLYRDAVEAFCFRRVDLVKQAQEELDRTEEVQRAVSTRLQWLGEESRLRRAIHWHEEKEMDVLRRAVDAVTGIRQSAASIIRVTEQMIEREPKYIGEPARVYEILWDLAHLGFTILDQAQRRLAGGASEVGETTPTWTEEVHMRLIKGIRDVYEAPRDIFPLVEVSVVAYEVRRVTELAANLADAVAGRGG